MTAEAIAHQIESLIRINQNLEKLVINLDKKIDGLQKANSDRLMKAEEAWEFLGISSSLFYRLLRAGNIHPTKIIGTDKRFSKPDLMKARLYLKKQL